MEDFTLLQIAKVCFFIFTLYYISENQLIFVNNDNYKKEYDMTRMELRAGIFEKLNSLLDDGESLRQLDDYNILPPYTMAELNARTDGAEIKTKS